MNFLRSFGRWKSQPSCFEKRSAWILGIFFKLSVVRPLPAKLPILHGHRLEGGYLLGTKCHADPSWPLLLRDHAMHLPFGNSLGFRLLGPQIGNVVGFISKGLGNQSRLLRSTECHLVSANLCGPEGRAHLQSHCQDCLHCHCPGGCAHLQCHCHSYLHCHCPGGWAL